MYFQIHRMYFNVNGSIILSKPFTTLHIRITLYSVSSINLKNNNNERGSFINPKGLLGIESRFN